MHYEPRKTPYGTTTIRASFQSWPAPRQSGNSGLLLSGSLQVEVARSGQGPAGFSPLSSLTAASKSSSLKGFLKVFAAPISRANAS